MKSIAELEYGVELEHYTAMIKDRFLRRYLMAADYDTAYDEAALTALKVGGWLYWHWLIDGWLLKEPASSCFMPETG